MSMNVPNGPRMFKHGVNYPQATRQKLYSKNTVHDIGSAVRFVCTVEVHLWHLIGVYRFGGLIDSCSALSVFTTCHSGRLGDAWSMGGKCVCRHLTTAWVAASVRRARLVCTDVWSMWEWNIVHVNVERRDIYVKHNEKPTSYRS